jgi:hypothetical protein
MLINFNSGLCNIGGDNATKKMERWVAVFQCALMGRPVLSKNFNGNKKITITLFDLPYDQLFH